VSSYLVAHPQGHVLCDTGVHCQAITDPIGRLGEERARRIGIRSQVGDEVVSQLARIGLRPDDIRYVINSHLHFDHCGGNEFFPHSTILVQRNEMEAARRPGGVPSYSPSVQDFDHSLDYRLVDGEYDVFGDGQMVLRLHRRCLLHPGEHGPGYTAAHPLGCCGNVALAGGAVGFAG
jgi:N-acyl homoserine lactone hydrolase